MKRSIELSGINLLVADVVGEAQAAAYLQYEVRITYVHRFCTGVMPHKSHILGPS